MHKLVLIRHGESLWNKSGQFTGWTDVDLTDKGRQEAREAGEILNQEGYHFDRTYTSWLKRAFHTLNEVLSVMDEEYIPVTKSWKLNERHYGALQGLNKKETARKYGNEQVEIWRRSYDVRPPLLEPDDPRSPALQSMYQSVDKRELPLGECLADTVKRVVPYFEQEIAPVIRKGENVLIAAHGNSLRALVKYLDHIDDDKISALNIPTGVPLVYELDDDLKPIRHYYLGDPAVIQARLEAVKKQGKA